VSVFEMLIRIEIGLLDELPKQVQGK